MSVSLKRIDLLLDEDLIARLEDESRRQQASVSDVVSRLLARDLRRGSEGSRKFVERIRQLRSETGSVGPDSAAIIRESRDTGW
jgi:uncharacterized protein (UPF0335 family)